MKKVTYLLAAFALATSATMTSCVRDNESAAVQQIRTAKAKQLEALASMQKAMGDADLVRANAEMLIATAEADLKKAQAAVELAKAEHQKSLTEGNDIQNQKDQVALEQAKLAFKKLQAKVELEIKNAVLKLEAAVLVSQQALEEAILAYKQFQDGEINKYLENLFGLYSKAIKEYQDKTVEIVTAKETLFVAINSIEEIMITLTPAVGKPGELGYVPAVTKEIKGSDYLKVVKNRDILDKNKKIAANEAKLATLKSFSQQSIDEAKVLLAETEGLTQKAEATKETAKDAAAVASVPVTELKDIHTQDIYNVKMLELDVYKVKIFTKKYNSYLNTLTWNYESHKITTVKTEDPYAKSEPVELTTVTGKVIPYIKDNTYIGDLNVFNIDQQMLKYAADQASLYIAELEAGFTALNKKYEDAVAEEVKAITALAAVAVTTDAEYLKYLGTQKALDDARAESIAASNALNAAHIANDIVQNDPTSTTAQKTASTATVATANAKVITAIAAVDTANTANNAQLAKLNKFANGNNGEFENAKTKLALALSNVEISVRNLNSNQDILAYTKTEKANIDQYINLSTKPEFKAAYEAKFEKTLEADKKWNDANAAFKLADANVQIYKARVEALKAYTLGSRDEKGNLIDVDIEKAIRDCEDAIAVSKVEIANMGDIDTMDAYIKNLNQTIAALEVEVVAYKAKADALKVKIDAEMAAK